MPQLWGFCLSAFTGALEAKLKASRSVNAAYADLQSEVLNEALRSFKRVKLGRGPPQPWAMRSSSRCSSVSMQRNLEQGRIVVSVRVGEEHAELWFWNSNCKFQSLKFI